MGETGNTHVARIGKVDHGEHSLAAAIRKAMGEGDATSERVAGDGRVGAVTRGVADLSGFDAEEARDGLVAGIRDIVHGAGFGRVVLGISGGKDSTVTAALCARALGAGNVLGVLLPDGTQPDISDSHRVIDALGIRSIEANIHAAHRGLIDAVDLRAANGGEALGADAVRESDINVAPRLRMAALRYVGQATGAMLAGTGNASEIAVGYFTKDGDSSCDLAVLAGLTSVEVVEVGKALPEIPRDLVEKIPTDGLSGKPDEERLGVSYVDIHNWLRRGTSGDGDVDEAIAKLHARTRHKRQPAKVAWERP